MSSIASNASLQQLVSKFGTTLGILALGSQDGTVNGTQSAIRVDANGRLEVSVVASGSSAINLQTDDNGVPAGQSHESTIQLLYGYDTSGSQWQRVLTDGSGKLQVYTP